MLIQPFNNCNSPPDDLMSFSEYSILYLLSHLQISANKVPSARITAIFRRRSLPPGLPLTLNILFGAETASDSRSLGDSDEFSSGISVAIEQSVRAEVRSNSRS
jgi:hypothetical protein